MKQQWERRMKKCIYEYLTYMASNHERINMYQCTTAIERHVCHVHTAYIRTAWTWGCNP
jgi:hypothetical protein